MVETLDRKNRFEKKTGFCGHGDRRTVMPPDPPHVRAAGLSTEKAAEEAGKALCGVEGFNSGVLTVGEILLLGVLSNQG